MVSGSHYMPLGVSVVFYDAIARGMTPLGTILTDAMIGYSHKISAVGGFDTATISLAANLNTVETWLEQGIGRHVEVYSENNVLVWEGFVDSIDVQAAGLSLTRGPMMDVSNRVSVMYTPILDATTDPAIMGATTETTIQDDEESHGKYGILETVLNGGNMLDDGTTNDAESVRDVFLAENSEPKTASSLAIGNAGAVALTLNCKGYFYYMEKYVYNDGTYNYSVTCTAKIENVLGADPNGIFSSDYSQMGTNAALTTGLEATNRTAWDIIKETLTIGDGADARWTFGIYEGRRPVYAAIPSTVFYLYSIYSERNIITLQNGQAVQPWAVRPGKWALVPDFLAGKIESIPELHKDSRAIFIESVDFTAPYSVTLTGAQVSTLPQILAMLGYGGIS